MYVAQSVLTLFISTLYYTHKCPFLDGLWRTTKTDPMGDIETERRRLSMPTNQKTIASKTAQKRPDN
jgi:hypothetical protein